MKVFFALIIGLILQGCGKKNSDEVSNAPNQNQSKILGNTTDGTGGSNQGNTSGATDSGNSGTSNANGGTTSSESNSGGVTNGNDNGFDSNTGSSANGGSTNTNVTSGSSSNGGSTGESSTNGSDYGSFTNGGGDDGSTSGDDGSTNGDNATGQNSGGGSCNETIYDNVKFFIGDFGEVDNEYKVGRLKCNRDRVCNSTTFSHNTNKNSRRCISEYCLYNDINGRCVKRNEDNSFTYSTCMSSGGKCYINQSCAENALCKQQKCIEEGDTNYVLEGTLSNGQKVYRDSRCVCNPSGNSSGGPGDQPPVDDPTPLPTI